MKRRLLLGFASVLALLVVLIGGALLFATLRGNPTFSLPDTGLKASSDPAVIAEGEYLFHGPMHCTACHDSSKEVAFTRKPQEKVDPIGGMVWDMGPMGRPVSANLTADKATGLGAKSDEHIARVLQHGVGEDGKLRPFMAIAVAPITAREIVALLSYLRTLPAKAHAVEEEQWGIVAKLLIATGAIGPKHMQPARFVAPASEPNPKRGEYLANGPALCFACHSPYDFLDGMKLTGAKFSGCFEPEPGHDDTSIETCAPNLTPDPNAGHITAWSEDMFLARFRSGAYTTQESPMPWVNFSNMTEPDLRSIYRYLRSLPPSPRATGPTVRKVGSFQAPKP
jgi:mono/diheme cytochrome c family protein